MDPSDPSGPDRGVVELKVGVIWADWPRSCSSWVSVPAQVSYDDMERLRPLAHMEKVRIPHFMQDQARYAQQLAKIMAVNQLTDEELRSII